MIDTREIKAFFDDRGVKHGCPLCANPSWNAIQSEDVEGGVVLAYGHWRFEDMRGVKTIVLCCTGCGFIRQHDLRTFEEWRTQKVTGNADHDQSASENTNDAP